MEENEVNEGMKKLEDTLAGWFSKLPFHLPEGGRKWLAENVWLIVVIGVVLSILAVISTIQTIVFIAEVSNSYSAYGIAIPQTNMTALWISVATYAAAVAIEAAAIKPLRLQKKQGWQLLFLALVVSVIGALISSIVGGSIISTITLGAIVGVFVGGFFLFEIRSYFGGKKPEVTTAVPTKDGEVPQ